MFFILKAFFVKIKTDRPSQMAICGRKTGYTSDFLISSKYVDIGNKKIRLAKPNSTQQIVCKNIQKHGI